MLQRRRSAKTIWVCAIVIKNKKWLSRSLRPMPPKGLIGHASYIRTTLFCLLNGSHRKVSFIAVIGPTFANTCLIDMQTSDGET